MLRKTILILALPLSLSLPSWGAAGKTATKPIETKGDVAASLAQDRDADLSDAENVDCFYQQHANHPTCAKSPKAQAPDGTPGLYRKAGN